jgi:hypothetical protein
MAGLLRMLLLFIPIALQLSFVVNGQQQLNLTSSISLPQRPSSVPSSAASLAPKSTLSTVAVPAPKSAASSIPNSAPLSVSSSVPQSTAPSVPKPPVQASPVANSPSTDDFYKPPEGFEKAKPGTILKYRPVPNPIKLEKSMGPINLAAAWQILYRTQNSAEKPGATVLTLLVPYNAKKGNLFSLSYFTVYLHSPL